MRPAGMRPDTVSFTNGCRTGLSPGPRRALLASSGLQALPYTPRCASPPPVSLTNPHIDSHSSLSSACSITGPGFFSGRQSGQVGLSWALCPALSLQG